MSADGANAPTDPKSPTSRVGLFVTCIADVLRPRVGFAAAALLERAGFEVVVPPQACCGQASFNSGDKAGARRAVKQAISAFAGLDHVVVPSGSCAAMLTQYMSELFPVGSSDYRQAEEFATRVFELTQFLDRFGDVEFADAIKGLSLTYHDSCSGLRQLGIKDQPRSLIAKVDGLELKEMKDPEACCGFGGAFCVKYPDISAHIADDKCDQIEATGADAVVLGDVGCLLNIEGRLHRTGSKTKALHIAEILAGMTEAD